VTLEQSLDLFEACHDCVCTGTIHLVQ